MTGGQSPNACSSSEPAAGGVGSGSTKTNRHLPRGHQNHDSIRRYDSSSCGCDRRMAADGKEENLIQIEQLIDLKDSPYRLSPDEIDWSTVRCNTSDCICCCRNNSSIDLVTTDKSYQLDHIAMSNIRFAQTSPGLIYLALSNHRKLVIIKLVARKANEPHANTGEHSDELQRLRSENKIVNLAGSGLTMNDIIFWCWLDDATLAVLSRESLFTCSLDQTYTTHPAQTSLHFQAQPLSLIRVFDIHQHLGAICQVTDIQRDTSGNLYAISGLYPTQGRGSTNLSHHTSTMTRNRSTSQQRHHHDQDYPHPLINRSQDGGHRESSSISETRPHSLRPRLMKSSFGSVPSRLSQLIGNNDISLESNKLNQSFDLRRLVRASSSASTSSLSQSSNVTNGHNGLNNTSANKSVAQDPSANIDGLVQIYCKIRDRGQLIRAHAATFTLIESPSVTRNGSISPSATQSSSSGLSIESSSTSLSSSSSTPTGSSTILVTAHSLANRLKVHLVEMSTSENQMTSGRAASPVSEFNSFNERDFPTSIVCTRGETKCSQLAMITTKYGQLFVCSIQHSTILFSTRITNDLIISTVLEQQSDSLMAICSNGQVILVRLNHDQLATLLERRNKRLRHVASSPCVHLLSRTSLGTVHSSGETDGYHDVSSNKDSSPTIETEMIISTRL